MTARPDRARASAIAGLVLAGACLSGCAAPAARTTFLRSADLIDMTDRMASSLAADPAVGGRAPADEPWIVSLDAVANHTNEIIPEREKWLYVGRVRALLARSELSRERAIVWVIPPERWPIVAQELGARDAPADLRLDPTHLLTAEFHALTVTSGRGRSDAYVCDFQLLDLARGTIVWEDAWEVKRAITGVTYD